MRISEPEGAVAAADPPWAGCFAWSVEDCLHAPSASAQRPQTRLVGRMARYQNHFFLHCSSRVTAESVQCAAMRPLLLALTLSFAVRAEDVVRLGNLKFAHYGAVSHMKEVCPKYGVRLEERMFAKGLDIVPGILAGEIDLAASALDGAVAGRAASAPVYVVAGFAKGGARILAKKDGGITKIEQLKGRKVGTARGGAQELLLYAELDKHGLAIKDVQVVFLAYADLNQALQAAQVDAISQSEPESSQA